MILLSIMKMLKISNRNIVIDRSYCGLLNNAHSTIEILNIAADKSYLIYTALPQNAYLKSLPRRVVTF
jgi:hypothetical protein